MSYAHSYFVYSRGVPLRSPWGGALALQPVFTQHLWLFPCDCLCLGGAFATYVYPTSIVVPSRSSWGAVEARGNYIRRNK